MIRLGWSLGLVLLTSCSRVNTKTYVFPVPEAETLEELQYIEATLWKEQDLLPEGIVFYERIEVSLQPAPTLSVTVDAGQLRKKKLIERLHRWGYTVDGRTGDPVDRAAFLEGGP